MPIEVTARDTETGESQTVEIDDNFVIMTAGRCYIAHHAVYGNGTQVITVKVAPDDEARPAAATPEDYS